MIAAEKDIDRTKNILLIEEDDHLRNMLHEFLQSEFFYFLLAKDGLEGMNLLETEDVDLLIVDIKVPFISGIGLIQFANETKPGMPIICITDYGLDCKSIPELECVAKFFRKPFDFTEIQVALNELL